MVWTDPVSQDAAGLARLVDHYDIPVLAIHAPTLLVTQRVWGREPWEKLHRSCRLALELGAGTVVVHPPFRWQREYAAGFVAGVERLADEYGVRLAVENMYPWRARGRELLAYCPGWDPLPHPYRDVTLDLSHTATAGVDGLAMARALGNRLTHLHLADGQGSAKDEHLVPGQGTQPCEEVLGLLAERNWNGTVVLEVNTRRAPHPRRSARPTSPRRSRSPGCTWPAGSRPAGTAAAPVTAASEPDAGVDAAPAGTAAGGEDRRGDILAAAREEFAQRGFDGTTLRGIARAAGRRPPARAPLLRRQGRRLHGGLRAPRAPPAGRDRARARARPGRHRRAAASGCSSASGTRPPGRQRIVALLSASLTSEAGARMLREFLTREVFARIVAALDADQPELRASLAASQMMGLVVARYVVLIEPLASLRRRTGSSPSWAPRCRPT